MNFDWDPSKAAANLRKHGASFHEAAAVFDDSLAITYADPRHSEPEQRHITKGIRLSMQERGVKY